MKEELRRESLKMIGGLAHWVSCCDGVGYRGSLLIWEKSEAVVETSTSKAASE